MESGNNLQLVQMRVSDFEEVKKFYDDEQQKLSDKKFFLKYTDEELRSILSGNGYFLGGFINGKLVATCAVDFDKEYGKIIKKAVFSEETSQFSQYSNYQFYEFSGIFVADGYRKRGYANLISKGVADYARENLSPSVLCSLVQYDNFASSSNLKKLGFAWAHRQAYGEYLFDYFILKV